MTHMLSGGGVLGASSVQHSPLPCPLRCRPRRTRPTRDRLYAYTLYSGHSLRHGSVYGLACTAYTGVSCDCVQPQYTVYSLYTIQLFKISKGRRARSSDVTALRREAPAPARAAGAPPPHAPPTRHGPSSKLPGCAGPKVKPYAAARLTAGAAATRVST